MNIIKWIGTIFVLIGILLTNLNTFPINIFFHGFGVILWTTYGFFLKDKAIITNFGFQIPIFAFGIVNYFT
ncbi:MAG: hypothetical protein CBD13_001455 [Candidatus Pelagibacter sp. TMED153]|nr:MAG: hypothetical protein CBD13_001455 [Candidatus Pelagibacter sp. TMED153]